VRRAYWDTGGVEEASGTSPSRDGTAVAWRALGDGEPLVLINGYAGTKADWDPGFLGALGADNRVLCPDNRGMGETPLGSEPASVEVLAADVVAILDDLGIERAPIAGWSMGGFVAQTIAADYPERTAALILIGSDAGGELSVSAEREVFLRLIDHSGTPREQASRLIRLLFPDPPASAIDAEFGDLVAEARAALDPEALRSQEALMASWHRTPCADRLGRISAPVLCAHGAADVIIPAANSDALAANLPGSWKAIFPGAGHAVMAMEPDRLAAVIATFLGRA
jgi:pimeloyl-ACP methyl ester carboxylesterase